jgi:hypothetical protein
MTEDLLGNGQLPGGHDFEDQTNDAHTQVNVACQPGSYTNSALATITWPAGYVQTGGSNPIGGQSDSITIDPGWCDTVIVPGVRGFSEASAEQSLTAVGLTVGNVYGNNQCLDDADSVVGQSIGSGTQMPRGTAVNLSVSTGYDTHGKLCPIL